MTLDETEGVKSSLTPRGAGSRAVPGERECHMHTKLRALLLAMHHDLQLKKVHLSQFSQINLGYLRGS